MEGSSPPTSRDQLSQLPDPVNPCSLEDALVRLRLWSVGGHGNLTNCSHHDQLQVGDTWNLGHEGLRVMLLETPSPFTPARLAATATTSATALPEALLQPTPTPPPPTPSSAPRQTTEAPVLPAASDGTTSSTGSTDHAKERAPAAALSDFFARRFHAAIMDSPATLSYGIRSDYDTNTVGQFVLETNHAAVSPTTGTVSLVFDLFPGGAGGQQRLLENRKQKHQHQPPETGGQEPAEMEMGFQMAESLRKVAKQTLLSRSFPEGGLDIAAARSHVESVEDQRHLRHLVAASDGIAFIANGSVLPRRSGSDDRPMEAARGAVPFQSPDSLRTVFRLPHRGDVEGMLVPRGVTVIVGGGYHGKSTLLRALAVGVYDKVPGDGRELAVTDPGAVTVRAEDGRPVSGVDISPFISSLPSSAVSAARGAAVGCALTNGADVGAACDSGANARAVVGQGAGVAGGGGSDSSGSNNEQENTTERFSTGGASGSTSQAANVVEALEAGATALLLDEDTCAGNFMIRDSRMRAMVHHEPITPFIYRVSSLWLELGVSSVIVVGGCGDYFDVHNTAILVDNYAVSDATERGHSISRRFCVGRVQYAGRGLVHRLPWPGDPSQRAIVPRSVLGPSAIPEVAPTNKRKRESSCNSGGSVGETVPQTNGSAGERHHADGISKDDGTCNGDPASHLEGSCPGGGERAVREECRVTSGGQGKEKSSALESEEGEAQHTDRHALTGGDDRPLTNRCQCPCFCGRGHRAGLFNSPHGAVGDTASDRIARVGSSSADLSRVEQLVGGEAMIRGCALGAGFVARATELSPTFLSVSEALDLLDAAVVITKRDEKGGGGEGPGVGDGGGLRALLLGASGEGIVPFREREQRQAAALGTMLPVSGGPLVALPRRFEVAAALHRIRGVRFQFFDEVAAQKAKDGEENT